MSKLVVLDAVPPSVLANGIEAEMPSPPRKIAPLRLTPSQKSIFLKKNNLVAAAIFSVTLAAYGLSLWAALAAPSLVPSAVASLLCGLCIGLLFIVGHDACHQAFTSSKLANRLIGRIAFLPSLHPFSLWDLGHNRTHHRFNNVHGKDYVWEPMSPDEYRRSPLPIRLIYRFYRNPLGVFFYYGIEIWAKRMAVFPSNSLADRRKVYLWDLLTVWLFLPVQAWAIVRLGVVYGHSPLHSLAFGLLIPFLMWNALMSFVIYLHHIHPDIRWYGSIDEWRFDEGKIAGVGHVRFPNFVGKLLLHIMEHGAHHHAPGVPLYNLAPLQKIVIAHGGVAWRWSPREFLRICGECKLFDYDSGTWRRFDSFSKSL